MLIYNCNFSYKLPTFFIRPLENFHTQSGRISKVSINIIQTIINIKMQDQQLCQFQFKITPTKIINSSKSKSNCQKSILIKLGNKEGKCKVMGQPFQITSEATYSKSAQKFYPIKGIVKVYDVNPDGTEMILCVGAFNTEELLSQKQKTINLQRDVGPCKIFLTIQTKNLTYEARQNINQAKQKQANKQTNKMDMMINIGSPKPELQNNERKFLKSPRVSQSDCQTPYMMDDSCEFLEQYHERGSEGSDDVKFNEKQALGQQLVEQRRKNKVLEEKLEKCNIKIQLLRKNISQKNAQLKSYYQSFKNFTVGLETDLKGQYIFEMNEKKREVTLRYKANIKFKEIFEEFIAFMIRKMTENGALTSSERTIEDEAEVNRILTKIENYDQEKKKTWEENYKLTNQTINLRNQVSQKTIEIQAKDSIIKKKIEEHVINEDKIRKLSEEKKSLEGMNHYLQQRDAQMEQIIATKENTIESLKKMLTDNNEEYEKLVKIVKNQQLQIEQMKQENANLLQTIENYRQNYGELKTAKDKALQRQFKECLRWIDQQNHDDDLVLEQSTQSYSETPNVTSIMKSIGEIENMPLEEISLIRKEVINVLKRLDEFVAKNS